MVQHHRVFERRCGVYMNGFSVAPSGEELFAGGMVQAYCEEVAVAWYMAYASTAKRSSFRLLQIVVCNFTIPRSSIYDECIAPLCLMIIEGVSRDRNGACLIDCQACDKFGSPVTPPHLSVS